MRTGRKKESNTRQNTFYVISVNNKDNMIYTFPDLCFDGKRIFYVDVLDILY